jgi:hypothetical protein
MCGNDTVLIYQVIEGCFPMTNLLNIIFIENGPLSHVITLDRWFYEYITKEVHAENNKVHYYSNLKI